MLSLYLIKNHSQLINLQNYELKCICEKNGTHKNILLKQFLIDGYETYMRSVNPEIKSVMPLAKNYKIIGTVIETRFSSQADRKTVLQKEAKFPFSLPGAAHLKPI